MGLIGKDLLKIQELIQYNELTLSIYRLGRIVISRICPERLEDFPEFDYTDEQEKNLLLLLAELSATEIYQET